MALSLVSGKEEGFEVVRSSSASSSGDPLAISGEGGVDWMRECCFLHGLVGGERKERERVFCCKGDRQQGGQGGADGGGELRLTCGPEEGYVASMCCVFDTYSTPQIWILRVQVRILQTRPTRRLRNKIRIFQKSCYTHFEII